MSTIARPNRDALHKALDIYSDAMRPFLVRIEMNPVFRNFSFKTGKISEKLLVRDTKILYNSWARIFW